MNDVLIEMDHVCKKFKKGEMYDSLRDLIPGLFRKYFSSARAGSLNNKREFWAVYDFCMVGKRGESIGIIGRNGAHLRYFCFVLGGF